MITLVLLASSWITTLAFIMKVNGAWSNLDFFRRSTVQPLLGRRLRCLSMVSHLPHTQDDMLKSDAGTGITVFGTVPETNPRSRPPTVVYRVDAAQPFTTTQPVADRDVSNQPLFSYAFGSQWEKHNIEIEVLDAQTPFTLEKFFIFPENATQLDSGSSPDDDRGNTKGTETIQTPPTTQTSSTTPNSATNTIPSSPSLDVSSDARFRQTTRILAVFLGITGFMVIVMTILLALPYIRRRRPALRGKSCISRPGQYH